MQMTKIFVKSWFVLLLLLVLFLGSMMGVLWTLIPICPWCNGSSSPVNHAGMCSTHHTISCG